MAVKIILRKKLYPTLELTKANDRNSFANKKSIIYLSLAIHLAFDGIHFRFLKIGRIQYFLRFSFCCNLFFL